MEEDKTYIFSIAKDTNKTDKMIDGLEQIVQFEKDVTKNRDIVKEHLLTYSNNMKILRGNLDLMIKDQNDEHEKYQAEYDEMVASSAKETKLTAKKYEIDESAKRIKMIQVFTENFDKTPEVFEKIDQSVEDFLDTIEASCDIYSAVLKTAKVSRDLNAAYNTLSELEGLDQLTLDIQKSWDDLSAIMDELVNATNYINS